MEPPRPWLCQGDLFTDVPICGVVLDSLVGVRFSTVHNGTAILITEDCQLDKRTSRAQRPKISRLQFAPVHDLPTAGLDVDTVRRLRSGDKQPPEAFYLKLSDEQEGVVFLGESYPIPAAYFRLESKDFSDDPGADPADPFHVVPTANDSRALTVDPAERRWLLQEKMAWYWTHMNLPPQETG